MLDSANLKYLPILDIRPAELVALQELPNKDKDGLHPLFRLRPWVGSHKLQNSIEKLDSSFGGRTCFLEVGEEEVVESGKRRPVHDELDGLRVAQNGYQNWFEFLKKDAHVRFIPGLQLRAPNEFVAQIKNLYSLERGLLLRIDSPSLEVLAAVCAMLSEHTGGGLGVFLVLDYGKQNSGFLKRENEVKSAIAEVAKSLNKASLAISASSFPDGFVSIVQQNIFERILFEKVKGSAGVPVIYSDRGGARAEKQTGGGGLPAPRLDYAEEREWHFFRENGSSSSQFFGYQAQALKLMKSPQWDKKLKLWACQMIERTANGDSKGGISSPNRATAVRINMHLHRQLYYGDSAGFYDTDEEWVG